MKKKVKDHKGIEYNSQKEMCAAYNINLCTFKARISKGMSLEEALTISHIANGRKVIDHLGNKYNSVKELCDYWNIPYNITYARIRSGWDIKKAIETPATGMRPAQACFDHLGNRYESIRQLCDTYDILPSTYHDRLKSGMSLEEVLTKSEKKKKRSGVTDHQGNYFKSVNKMCAYWGITKSVFSHRMKSGDFTLKEALETEKTKHRDVYDHLGNKYSSIRKMCNTYGISTATFYRRKDKLGMSLEDILTKDIRNNHFKTTDHKGKVFDTKEDMCKAYNITSSRLDNRLKSGMSLEKALTTPRMKDKSLGTVIYNTIIFGKRYEDIRDIIKLVKYKDIARRFKGIKYKHMDRDILFTIENAQEIKLEFISIDNKAWYKVKWTEKLQNTRQIIEHCRPNILSLYDKSNPKGEWNPLVGSR